MSSSHTCRYKLCERKGVDMRCGKCKSVHYCGRECQKADWPSHRDHCRSICESCPLDSTTNCSECRERCCSNHTIRCNKRLQSYCIECFSKHRCECSEPPRGCCSSVDCQSCGSDGCPSTAEGREKYKVDGQCKPDYGYICCKCTQRRGTSEEHTMPHPVCGECKETYCMDDALPCGVCKEKKHRLHETRGSYPCSQCPPTIVNVCCECVVMKDYIVTILFTATPLSIDVVSLCNLFIAPGNSGIDEENICSVCKIGLCLYHKRVSGLGAIHCEKCNPRVLLLLWE